MTISTFAVAVAPVVFAFTMVYAGLTDLTTMKIRNSLVLLFLLAYVVLAPLLGFAVHDIGWSAAVAAAVLVFTFGCYAFGWIGGGDAKLAAVTALWFGVDYTPIYLFYTALLGGALSFAILQFRTMTLPTFLPNNSWIVRLHSPGGAGHISRLKSIPDLFADLGFTIEAAPDVEDFVEDNLDELVATVHDELNQWGLQVNDVNVLIGLAFDPQSAPKADPHLVRPKCAEPFQNSPLRRDQCWKPKGVKIRSRDTCHNSANTPQT